LAKDTTLEVDVRVMDVNYFGPVALTKAALPYILKVSGGGSSWRRRKLSSSSRRRRRRRSNHIRNDPVLHVSFPHFQVVVHHPHPPSPPHYYHHHHHHYYYYYYYYYYQGSSGHIVVVNSVQGRIGLPSRTSYSASKHALTG